MLESATVQPVVAAPKPVAVVGTPRGLAGDVHDLVAEGLRRMIATGRVAGHWEDSRGTADSLIALSTALPRTAFPQLRAFASDWLASRRGNDANGVQANWSEEVWDTSVALVALSCDFERYQSVALEGARWLAGRYQPLTGSWNDEPWETLWALLALHSIATRTESAVDFPDVSRSFRWLLGLVNTPSRGLLINWHYSGLLVLVIERYLTLGFPLASSELVRELSRVRDDVVDRALQELAHGDGLWTEETWSNALVLWGLSEAEGLHEETPGIQKIVSWFRPRMTGGADIFSEDLAFACTALFATEASLHATRSMGLDSSLRSISSRYSDDDEHRRFLERCFEAASRSSTEDTRSQLETRLEATSKDFVARPKMFTAQSHAGYYSVNLNKKAVNILLILTVTAGLTVLSVGSELLEEPYGRVLAVIPVTLGVLATIAQLADFSLRGPRPDAKQGRDTR